MNELELKLHALDLAARDGGSPEAIIQRAEVFFKFLNGGK